MAPLAVVEEFEVFEDCVTCLGSRAPLSLVHQFDFESGEEAFRHRIVPTVSAPAHAADDAVLGEQSLIFLARVLAADAIAGVMTEYQARFLVTSLQMLATWSQQRSPITKIKVVGVLVAHDQNGTVIMPAPVDYVSWTPRIAGFATDPKLLAMQNRVLLTTGKMTPLARHQLGANGWTVHEGTQL